MSVPHTTGKNSHYSAVVGARYDGVPRCHGINASQIFKWHSQYEDDTLIAVASGEEVVPASEHAAANKQTRKLRRLPDKKTTEAEIIKEGVECGGSVLTIGQCCPG
ncbi:hypothetical protein ACR9GP_23575 [Enterobacter ludwigii]